MLATEEESLFDDDFLADDAKDYADQSFDDDESQHWTFSTRAVIFNPVDEIIPKLVEASSDSDNDQEEVEMSKQRQQSFLQLEYRRRMQQKKLEEEQLEKRAANTRVFFTAEAESSNIGMDSQSSVHIFKDQTLLTRIRKADHPVLIGGINKAAPKIKITKQGDFDGISVLVHSSASCNIFSQSKLKADGARVSYLESTDCFLLHPVGSTTIYKFRSVSSHGSVGKFYVSSAADRVLYPTDHDCRKAYVKLRLLDHQKVSAAEKSAADKALSSSDGPFLGELALVSSHLPVHNSSLLRSLDNALDESDDEFHTGREGMFHAEPLPLSRFPTSQNCVGDEDSGEGARPKCPRVRSDFSGDRMGSKIAPVPVYERGSSVMEGTDEHASRSGMKAPEIAPPGL